MSVPLREEGPGAAERRGEGARQRCRPCVLLCRWERGTEGAGLPCGGSRDLWRNLPGGGGGLVLGEPGACVSCRACISSHHGCEVPL